MAVREATAETLRESYQREAALWTTLTSGAVSLVQPPVPSPRKPKGDERATAGDMDTNRGAQRNAETVLPPWVQGPGATGHSGRRKSEFYKTFLASILEQTGGAVVSRDKNEVSNILLTGVEDVPIELAATKLMVLNGANAKKF